MSRSRIVQLICVVASMLIVALGAARPSLAEKVPCPPQPDFDLPSGEACDFPLFIHSEGGENRVCRNFYDKNGKLVRVLSAGKGYALTFKNVDTGTTLTTPANGSNSHTTYNADGSTTTAATGHNVIILFPSDFPPGPSTVLYRGKVVYTVDPTGVWTLTKVTGNSTDICAALSP